MNVVLWILQGLLAVAFLGAGITKAITPLDKLAVRMAWVNALPPMAVRAIGVIEILGAIGLIAPWLTQILPILTPIAALGLVITMIGAAVWHIRLKEFKEITPAVVLGILVLIVAIGRFSGAV
jgi:uncharacterized membrane protein